MTDFVIAQREALTAGATLHTPVERAYPVSDPDTRRLLGLDVER